MGRDTYMKSLGMTVGIGFYLPIEIANRVIIEAGPVIKFYRFADSTDYDYYGDINQHDELKPYKNQGPPEFINWGRSINASARLRIRVYGPVYVTGNYEKSLTGNFKYKVIRYGVGIRF